MSKKKTAAADPIDLGAVEIFALPTPTGTAPAITFDGEAPAKGSVIVCTLKNGVRYTGEVYSTTEAGGNVLIELVDGLTPEASK